MWKPICWKFSFLLCLSLLAIVVSARDQGNPADDIVSFINENRTASKLSKLYASPGLGCMALQYISECIGNCTSNNTLVCQPSDADITEVYAPNCGVELPTVDIVSGHLIGCQWDYLSPDEAFSKVLIANNKTLSLLHSKEHSEVGVGFRRAHKGAYFWCALFSSGRSNSTFVLEGGKGIDQRDGCFSGNNSPCSEGRKHLLAGLLPVLTMLICFVFEIVMYA